DLGTVMWGHCAAHRAAHHQRGRKRPLFLLPMRTLGLFLLAAGNAAAQSSRLSPAVRQYVTVDTPTVIITHVRVIDGTGAAPRENQTVTISAGKIASIAPSAASPAAGRGLEIDGSNKTLLPGLVMLHEHMFYPPSV